MRKATSPVPDGYTVSFFAHYWDIISDDVYKEIHNFINKSVLYVTINSTNLILNPKMPHQLMSVNIHRLHVAM